MAVDVNAGDMRCWFFYVEFKMDESTPDHVRRLRMNEVRKRIERFRGDFIHTFSGVAFPESGNFHAPYVTFYLYGSQQWAELIYKCLAWDCEYKLNLVISMFDYVERKSSTWVPPSWVKYRNHKRLENKKLLKVLKKLNKRG